MNKATTNESKIGVGNKTITNIGNDIVGISVHYYTPLYFGLAVYGEAQVLFRSTVINGACFSVDAAPDIGHPVPLLIALVILLEGC